MCALAGCGALSRGTLYGVKGEYQFRAKTIGLCVIFDGEEQEALNEGRVVRRTITSAEDEGYAGDLSVANPRADAGIIMPPAAVTSLDAKLEHSRYFDDELIHPMIERTKAMLERRGYRVEVIGVPSGDVLLTDLAGQARSKGCQLLAVETVALARSWNIRRPYRYTGSSGLATSFKWQLYVGGLVLTNMSIFDNASNEVVWQHARREIDAEFLAPILAEVRDDNVAAERFPAHPGQYQVWMYRQSAERALHLMFRTLEPGFSPLPHGSGHPDSVAARRSYLGSDEVLVQPLESEILWLPGH